MDSPPQQQQHASEFLSLLDFYPAPALLLRVTTAAVVVYVNTKLRRALELQQVSTTTTDLVRGSERLRARALRAICTQVPTYDNFQLCRGEEVYYVTLTPLLLHGSVGEFVCCTFQNICEPEPNVLWNTIEKHPELRGTLFTQLPLGISQLCEDGDDFSWVYINRPTRQLLSSTLSLLLEKRTKTWWLEHMLSLDAVGRFVRFQSSKHLFPEHFAAVSLKRIENAPNGAARFVWLLDEAHHQPVLSLDDSQKLYELVKARTWQLEEAMHAKERFLATMSHEIRTPLTGIMGALILMDDQDISLEHRQILRIARLCSEQLLVLINDVLDRAKLEEGKVQLEMVNFDLHEVLADSMEIIATTASQKGIELILDIGSDVPRRVIGDPFRMRQVLANLISNAVKFTKEGHVLLRASSDLTSISSEAFFLHIVVQDTGVGIPTKAASDIFKPFVQADQSMTRRFGGTGLGLSIAQQLAILMGGKIWFEDALEGHGATFHFIASLAPCQVDALTVLPVLPRKRVLVVVRNPVFRRLLVERLSAWSCSVDSVATSTDALQLQSADYSLLVADINGAMDDARLLREFQLPVILLRMGGEEERLKEAKERSKAILLFKPVRKEELYRALCRALAGHDSLLASDTISTSITRKYSEPQLRILLVEDNITNQLIVSKMLIRLGQKNVTIAGDGRQAVETCKTSRFDLILMDIMMPVMNGWEATRQIRAFTAPPIYIVALSANVLIEDRQRCLSSGMDGVVTKPIQPAELERAIAAALELRCRPGVAHA